MRKPGGYSITVDPALPLPIEQDTVGCKHCGATIWLKAYEVPVHRCTCCDGFVCDRVECRTHCYPLEKRLSDWERAKKPYVWT